MKSRHALVSGRRCVIPSGWRVKPRKIVLSSRNFLILNYIRKVRKMRNNIDGSATRRNVEKRNAKVFCWTRTHLFEDKQTVKSSLEFDPGKNFPIKPMKKLLIASLCSVTLVLISFGQ